MVDCGIKSDVLDSIKSSAQKNNIQKIILFGSRARGDYHERSDIDIAVTGGDYSRFCMEINEFVPTLLKFDIVNMDFPIQDELINSIKSDGVVIYEKV